MTAKARIGLWLRLIAPRVVDNMTRAALKKHDKRLADRARLHAQSTC
jgi:hypothetical protein